MLKVLKQLSDLIFTTVLDLQNNWGVSTEFPHPQVSLIGSVLH